MKLSETKLKNIAKVAAELFISDYTVGKHMSETAINASLQYYSLDLNLEEVLNKKEQKKFIALYKEELCKAIKKNELYMFDTKKK